MYLVRLVYASKISAQFNEKDIVDILECARENNTKNHVTGLLCFSSSYFLQCLEGSRRSVNAIYQQILKDKRHENIVMLNYQEIIKREFSVWSMGYVPATALTRELNMAFSGTPEFSPYEMSGESAHQMMLALKESINVV